MDKKEPLVSSGLKQLRNRYRLVITNEDTYEEVVKFNLSRIKVYVVLSTLFILGILFTAAILIFTPLKYYIPGVGSGDINQVKEYRALIIRTDSLEKQVRYQSEYLDNIKDVLGGKITKRDTTTLALPKLEKSEQ